MKNIEFQNIELSKKLFGYHNTHLEKISRAFNITINSRGNAISLSGDAQDGHWARIILGYKKRHILIFFVI
jgi:phosphate starvation-inducible PhoH-like protein